MAKTINKETEQNIFDVSMRVFQEKGYAATKLQDIAKQANINQSLLHYYFRNKENLFKTVLRHKVLQLFSDLELLTHKNLDKTNKALIKELIDAYQQFFYKNPNFPLFVIAELNNNPQIMKEIFSSEELALFKEKSIKSINQVVKEINSDIPSEHLLISLISMILFPFMAKELLKLIFDKDEEDIQEFIKERSTILWDISSRLFN